MPMNEPKEKTFRVLMAETHSQYYEVKAKDEDEAIDRSGFDYDPDEDWAIQTYEGDYVPENCHYADITCEDKEEEEE